MNHWAFGLLLIIGTFLVGACSRPIAEFTYDGTLTAPAQVTFENQSEKATQYTWEFGDGVSNDESSPNHRYLSSGNYLVKLTATNEKNKSRSVEKRIIIAPPKECLVEMETPFGNMLIKLFDSTPKHQENFVKLVDEGYFDSLLFHRVIKGFMIQGGDPASRNASKNKRLGMGGPGYTVKAEFVDSLFHQKGALAAARQGDGVNPQKASSGSQFYIVQGSKVNESYLDQMAASKGFRYTDAQKAIYAEAGGTPQLDQDYTVFGQVIEGMAIIDSIAQVRTSRSDRPTKDVWMKIRAIK